jgi:hypothetical protein
MSKASLFAAALFIVSGAALAAPAASAPAVNERAAKETHADRNECVFVRSIYDFKPLDRNHLIIWAPTRRNAYLVQLGFPLPELQFAQRLAIVDRDHNGMLCGFGMDRIVVADSVFRQPSTILGMTRLDSVRIAQLEAQYDVQLAPKKKASGEAAAVTADQPVREQSESN